MISTKFWDFRPPPPCPHFTQPISTVRPQNFPIHEPPSPLHADVICTWSTILSKAFLPATNKAIKILTFQTEYCTKFTTPTTCFVIYALFQFPFTILVHLIPGLSMMSQPPPRVAVTNFHLPRRRKESSSLALRLSAAIKAASRRHILSDLTLIRGLGNVSCKGKNTSTFPCLYFSAAAKPTALVEPN